jgi:heat shock protein HtpX
MSNLYTQASKNARKTWFLMAIVFGVVICLGWFFSYYFQNPVVLYVFALFAVVMQIVSYWYSDKIVIKLSGAKLATREQYFDLYTIVENLAITAGLPTPKIYVVEDPAPNAFATGRDKNHAVVCATTGLLSLLDRTELEGVMAHELSHIGNRDMLVSTVAVVLVGFISIISDMFMRSLFWGGGRRSDRENGNAGSILMVIGIILAILAPLVGLIIKLAISRKREYLADASGALLTRYPEGLANALRKIGAYKQPMRRQSSAIAHLYLADPSGGKTHAISKLFMTHPPVADRIKALLGNKNESM